MKVSVEVKLLVDVKLGVSGPAGVPISLPRHEKLTILAFKCPVENS
jgi:hypothetical protein